MKLSNDEAHFTNNITRVWEYFVLKTAPLGKEYI